VSHVHADGAHGASERPAAAAARPQFAVSLLGASAFARLALVAAVSVVLWLAILWALA
jgi:hypothetical protein